MARKTTSLFALGSGIVALAAVAGVVGYSYTQMNQQIQELQLQTQNQQQVLQKKEKELAERSKKLSSVQKSLEESRQEVERTAHKVEVSRAQTRIVGVCLDRVAALMMIQNEAEALVLLGSLAESCEAAVSILDQLEAEASSVQG